MKAKTILISVATFVAGGLSAGALHWAKSASACESSPPVAATPPSETVDGHTCSLDPEARAGALAEFGEFAAKHLGELDASVTATFVGDKATLEPFLTAAIARESACCSFLRFDVAEVETGFRVTMRSDRDGVRELAAALEMMGAK